MTGMLLDDKKGMDTGMEHGFVKVAAVTPRIKVADTVYNSEQIILGIEEAAAAGAKIIVCPELCITGYTCGDLFLQGLLLRKAQEGLFKIAGRTREIDALIFVGLPLVRENKLYNVAAALYRGEVRGFIPKANIPAYAEFYESRHFEEGNREPVEYVLKCQEEEQRVLFGTNLLFEIEAVRGLKVGCEICEDIWMSDSPANSHAKAGATVIVNLSASDETVGKDEYRELLVKSSSARNIAGYVYTSAGEGESSQDMVFGGHNIIAENGTVLSQSRRFANQTIYGDIDIGRICHERRRMGTYRQEANGTYRTVKIPMKKEKTEITRTYGCLPFVPEDKEKRNKRCDEILSIQSCGAPSIPSGYI